MLSLPGETAVAGGIYEVIHAGHRAAHKAIIWAGETFPCCRECGEYVLFRFLHADMTAEQETLEHISADRDFSVPEMYVVKIRNGNYSQLLGRDELFERRYEAAGAPEIGCDVCARACVEAS